MWEARESPKIDLLLYSQLRTHLKWIRHVTMQLSSEWTNQLSGDQNLPAKWEKVTKRCNQPGPWPEPVNSSALIYPSCVWPMISLRWYSDSETSIFLTEISSLLSQEIKFNHKHGFEKRDMFNSLFVLLLKLQMMFFSFEVDPRLT